MILSVDAKNAALQGIADKLNTGTNSVLSLYVGATLAAEFTLTNPAEVSIANAVMVLKVPPRVLAVSSGVLTDAKILDASGALIATINVATEITLDKSQVYQGGYVSITSLQIGI